MRILGLCFLCLLTCVAGINKRLHRGTVAHLHRDKWVVITSISHPTPAVERLAALPGWKVVVVGDKKTPANWSYPGVDFLSVSKQKSLEFATVEKVPWKSYGRKNIGYLWAIKHGATIIYETDDDNVLLDTNITVLDAGEYPGYAAGEARRTVNVYDSFGLPNMWPRGFPLADIKEPAPTRFQRHFVKPLIQQGLANHDPDVDAIYRLTQPLGVNFSSSMFPTIVPKGLMCPFNSQNTVFLKDAFWALLIPVSTTMRVCDIWRGYWAQRLLWEIGGSLCFIPPTVVQHRNIHTLVNDFGEELDLYKDAGRLVDFLRAWKFTGTHFPEAVKSLSQAMADEGFWGQLDSDLTAAWVQDLTDLHYNWPAIVKEEAETIPVDGKPPIGYPLLPKNFPRLSDVYLVILYPPDVQDDLPVILQEMYEPIFGKVVHTGLLDPSGYTSRAEVHMDWVPCEQDGSYSGVHWENCRAKVMNHYPVSSSGGYLHISHDTLINICSIATFPRDKIWTSTPLVALEHSEDDLTNWFWDNDFPFDQHANFAKLAVSFITLDSVLKALGRDETKLFGLEAGNFKTFWKSIPSSYYYIPSQHREAFIMLSLHFLREKVHCDLALANTLGILIDGDADGDGCLPHHGVRLWDADINDPKMWGLSEGGLSGGRNWVHPADISSHEQDVTGWWKSLSCEPPAE